MTTINYHLLGAIGLSQSLCAVPRLVAQLRSSCALTRATVVVFYQFKNSLFFNLENLWAAMSAAVGLLPYRHKPRLKVAEWHDGAKVASLSRAMSL